MVGLEEKVRKRIRRKDLRRAILGAIGVAGMLSLAVVAPNVIGALGKLGIISPGKRQREIVNRARDRLVDSGFLKRDEFGYLRLTVKGKYELEKLEQEGAQLKKPKRWDGKCRVLIFDIPEQKRTVRNKGCLTLVAAGFQKLQQSVWVYPYPCEDFIALLKTDLFINKNLVYIVTDEIEGDLFLQRRFGLVGK